MPDCGDDFIMSHVQNRMLPIWIKADKRYPHRYDMFRTVYIDGYERIEGTSKIIGKDIKSLSWEELQELAVLKNLRNIPAMRATDLRYAREKAYVEYSKNILGKTIDTNEEGYNFSELPALTIDATSKKASNPKQRTNEEVLDGEQKNTSRADYRDWETDRKSTRLNSSHSRASRMPSSA